MGKGKLSNYYGIRILILGSILSIFFNNCAPSNLTSMNDQSSIKELLPIEEPTNSSLASNKIMSEGAEKWVARRILVRPRPGLSDADLTRLLDGHGGRSLGKINGINVHIVELPPQASEKAVAAILHKNKSIEFAEVDSISYPEATANDPSYSKQWHLPKIGVPTAWDYSTGQGIIIAILDTGVDPNHPDLRNQMIPGWNFYDNNSNSSDVYGHGTKVAGCAAASTNNAIGVASPAKSARIMPLRISAVDGGASFSTMATALTWAADHNVDVANISYQSVSGSATVQAAAQYMKNKGGVTVVAAGNTGVEQTFTSSTSMISVSGTTSSDTIANWSSFGSYVDLAAPGASIYTTVKGGTYGSVSGTSFASPITAGVIAMMMSVNPSLTPTEIENILFTTTKDLGAVGFDKYYGHGRIDAAAAVNAARGSAPIDTTAPSVAIVSPVDGSIVSGLVSVDVSASDSGGLKRVDLLVNGVLYASDTTSPYGFSIDSTKYANSDITVSAIAVDNANNAASSSNVILRIFNNTSPVPKLVIVDNPAAAYIGTWTVSTGVTGYYGTNYRYAAIGTGTNSATWTASLVPGSYRVYARWTAHVNRATDALYTVSHAAGQSQFSVNQRLNGGIWYLLGTFNLSESAQVRVNDSTTGPVVADAIRFEPAL